VLELCPSSNIRTHAVADIDEVKKIFHKFREAGVRMTVNTDGTYLLGTTLRKEFDLLLTHHILTEGDVRRCIDTARQATFLR